MEDKETREILTEQQLLSEILNHQGWPIARKILTDKILALQNAFDIDVTSPDNMFRDLQARKRTAEILFDFLRELEGSREISLNNEVPKASTHIVNLDD